MATGNAKEILYEAIERIGRDKLRMDLVADLESSKRYIKEIVSESFSKISKDDYQTMGDIYEALMHFLLTALSVPSERKINAGEIRLDIVIPSLKELISDPDRAIVIQFIRKNTEMSIILDTLTIQPNLQNIWAVTSVPFTSDCTIYEPQNNLESFSNIIIDISSFLSKKRIRNLKLVSD